VLTPVAIAVSREECKQLTDEDITSTNSTEIGHQNAW